MKILLIAPDLFGSHGGIARHCRLVLKVLTEAPQVDAVDAIVLRDRRGTAVDPNYFGPRGRTYLACNGNKAWLMGRVAMALLGTAYDALIVGHVNLAPSIFLRAPLQPARLNVALIYGNDAWLPLPRVRRAALQTADLVLAVSRFTADGSTRANQLDASRVAVTYCALDPSLAECGPERLVEPAGNSGGRRQSLLTVARLSLAEASKGHFLVLHALPQLLPSFPDLTYDIVGEGDLTPDLVHAARRLGVESNVRFIGAVSDPELRRYYHSCTAYVMPSRWEGFGQAFLEAMAHSRPIIAGRDAAPEILGTTALLVDPDDPRDVSESIRRLLSSPELQTQLGQAGRARLEERFTYEHFRRSLLTNFEQGLERRRSSALEPSGVRQW